MGALKIQRPRAPNTTAQKVGAMDIIANVTRIELRLLLLLKNLRRIVLQVACMYIEFRTFTDISRGRKGNVHIYTPTPAVFGSGLVLHVSWHGRTEWQRL